MAIEISHALTMLRKIRRQRKEASSTRQGYYEGVQEPIEIIIRHQDPVFALLAYRNKKTLREIEMFKQVDLILSPLSSGPLVVETVMQHLQKKGIRVPTVAIAVTDLQGKAWLPNVSKRPELVMILDDWNTGAGGTYWAVKDTVSQEWPGVFVI